MGREEHRMEVDILFMETEYLPELYNDEVEKVIWLMETAIGMDLLKFPKVGENAVIHKRVAGIWGRWCAEVGRK